MLEVELLAAGLLARHCSPTGCESLRLTDAGISALAHAHARNQAARTPHEDLVARVAEQASRAGRLAWCGLSLRVALPRERLAAATAASEELTTHQPHALWPAEPDAELLAADSPKAWSMTVPDVFSIRRSSVEACLEPVVHEIKVSRADLLGDLRRPSKRAAYLAIAGACWYVLGCDAKGRPIAQADEVPAECGVIIAHATQLEVVRPAPQRAMARLPLQLWLSLAQATPVAGLPGDAQGLL